MLSKPSNRPVAENKLTGRLLLKQFSYPHLSLLKVATLAGVLSTVFLCVMWLSFAMLVEATLVRHEPIELHKHIVAVFVFAALGKVCFLRLQTFFGDKASLFIRRDLRNAILALWREQSPLAEHLQSPGSAATQWVEDVEAMDGYFSKYWPQQALAIISPLIILCVVAWVNWLCALLLLISAPLIPLFMILVGMGAERLNQEHSLTRQRLAGHFLNRVANLTTISLLKGEESVLSEIESRSTRYRQIIMKTLRVAFLSSTVLEFFTSVAIASLAIYIGFSLYGAITWGPAGEITLFSGLLILILAPEFFQPLRTLSQYYHDKAAALGASNNLLKLFNSAISVNDKAKVSSISAQNRDSIDEQRALKPGLILKDVTIGYSSSRILAKHISINLHGNQLMVVTGPSGQGKTTLLNTIADYLPPLDGTVRILPTTGLTASISYLPQKPWIKNASVLDNITEFAPNASKEKIRKCLDTLGLAQEFDSRSLGLDSMLGEHGQGLSGGQLQRIALCRVLLAPTPIILLDEPTAKLDLRSKQLILEALDKLRHEAIVVVATHDPLLLEIADTQLSLDKAEELKHVVLV